MAMLEHAYNDVFYMPRTGINVANELAKFGILVGLWQLGEGVELLGQVSLAIV